MPGRDWTRLCRYVLRPPLADDRLHVLRDGRVQVQSEGGAWEVKAPALDAAIMAGPSAGAIQRSYGRMVNELRRVNGRPEWLLTQRPFEPRRRNAYMA